jgi:vacuolar-type H+-ATPase subunit I/STV1
MIIDDMERTCTECGKLFNDKLAQCPFCGKLSTKSSEPSLSSEQVKQLAKQVRKEFRNSLIFWLGIASLIFGFGLLQAYRSAVGQMQEFFVQRISEEFQQPKIHETVQEVAVSTAQQILVEEIQPEVDKFKAESESAIQETKELVNATHSQLESLSAFTELEDAALYGSRKAFTELLTLASQKDQIGIMAQRRITFIMRELSIYRSIPAFRENLTVTKNGETLSADKLTTSELFSSLEDPTMPKEYIRSLMTYTAQKPKQEVCREAKRIFETSDSLVACAATCGILSKVMDKKAEFFAFDDWLKICDSELQEVE